MKTGIFENNKTYSADTIHRFLTFFSGSELFGVAVEDVKEVIEYHRCFKIPLVPDYIHGIINLRGEVIPVIDLSSLLYRKKCEITSSTSILFIEQIYDSEKILTGVIISAVEAVTDIPGENIEAAPSFGEKIKSEYICGVGKTNDGFIVLLDIHSVFNLEDLSKFNTREGFWKH